MSEKIYPASQQKRKKEREKGNVAKSTDIVTLATLFIALTCIYFSRNVIFSLMDKFLAIISVSLEKGFSPNILTPFIKEILKTIIPLLCIVAATGIMANYFQVGLLLTPKSLVPDFKKINPITGFKRLFSKDSAIELLKSLLKVIGVIYIAFLEIKSAIFEMNYSYSTDMYGIYQNTFENIFNIIIKIAMLLLAISMIDFMYKKLKYESDLKMTKQEMMDEYKETEGNPHTKNRQREFGRMLTKKQIQTVKEATVLITNPTHFAIAIKYNRDEDYAPMVLFKGVDAVALKAREIAKENNIPIHENRPLARALYASVNEGDYIPTDFYDSIAQIISHIYSVNEKK